jgi:hypothetical protein
MQCEWCRTFSPGNSPPAGWVVVTQVTVAEEEATISLFRTGNTSELVGTYCSSRCCLEHLYARWVIGESAPATE